MGAYIDSIQPHSDALLISSQSVFALQNKSPFKLLIYDLLLMISEFSKNDDHAR